MNNPSWDVFRSQPDQTTKFEVDVARRLFCHEAGIAPSQLTCGPNRAGIENVPVETAEGWVAFQAKHSMNGSQNGDAFDVLRHVIPRVQQNIYQLNKIYCFSSGKAPATDTALTAEQVRVVSDLGAEGICVEWYYEDRILTILEDASTHNLVRASQAFFENLPQPFLDPQDATESPEGFRRLRFNERLSEFAGRHEELSQLEQFSESDNQFGWWHVTGPGFSGKSRLLLEYCHSLDGWHWGWLESDLSDFSFSNWIPNQDTFIVIDYALGRESEIQRLFQQIRAASYSDRFVHKVRLVLIEREYTGWLSAIEHVQDVGNWIAGQRFRREGLVLERLPNVLSAIDDFPTGEFITAIHELLQRERQRRWQNASNDAQNALALATATGGFSLHELPEQLRPETRSYLAQLDCSEAVAKMVGVAHTPHSYSPLQPDVFGELYVLDAIQNATPSSRTVMFQRAFELSPAGLVNCLYRCGQSFSEHPAFLTAMKDWSYDDASRMAFLAVFANSLDVAPFTQHQRTKIYRDNMSALSATSENLLFLERAIFGKILALFPNNNLQIEPAEIQLHVPLQMDAATSNPDLLTTLFPSNYCDAVLAAWRQLDETTKTTLLGPHLVEIFHHQIIRQLAARPQQLEPAQRMLADLVNALELAGGSRYSASIIAFQQLCSNAIAGLTQFSHKSEAAMDWADEIGRSARDLSTLERNGQSLILQSSNLDRIDLGLTILVGHFRHRDWQYKLAKLETIRRRGHGIQTDDTLKMLHYVQVAVPVSHGFSGEEEAQEVRRVLERCREYTSIVNTPLIAESFAMILGNLTGYASSFDLGQSTEELISEASQLACRFPEPQQGLPRITLNRLSTYFQNQINSGDLEAARQSLALAREMIEAANEVHHEESQRLHAGAFIDAPISRYVEGQFTLYDEAQAMTRFLSTSQAVSWQQMMSNLNASSRYFSEAQRSINDGDYSRAIRALEVLEFYDSVDLGNDYSQLISVIRGQMDA